MTEAFHTSRGLTKEEHKLHQKFSEYGMNARKWTRKCALLLPKIDRHQIWRKKGFGSMYEYAAKIAGMSRWSVDDALRISRKIEDKPALKKVAEEKGLNAVRPVAAIATEETAAFWAEKAESMSQPALVEYVKEIKKQDASTDDESKNGSTTIFKNAEKYESEAIAMELPPEVAEQLRKAKGEGSWVELMQEFLKLRAEKLQEEKPEPVKTKSRHIPTRIKSYAIKRTNGSCGYPGCVKPYTILHHTQRFALEKVHDPARLVPLCTAHERLAHHGLVQNEQRAPENWRVAPRPNRTDAKYAVDRLVQQFRVPLRAPP